MMKALELAERGRLTTWPNPWVGCVIVKNGIVIGEGFHRLRGEPHAEANAFMNCTVDPADSDVYVTLEPCSNYGNKLTPPCCELLVRKQVKRVYVALQDQDDKVKGRGIRYLNDQGIETIVGICQEQVQLSLRPYLHHRTTGKPFVICKVACGMNGNINCRDGSSQWITGDHARQDVHRLRAESQAVLVGVGTVFADNPQLTVRGEFCDRVKSQPLRVILDPSGRCFTNLSLNIHNLVDAETLIVTCNPNVLHSKTVLKMPGSVIDIDALLVHLGGRGILQLLVEGGADTWTRLIEGNHVNSIIIYKAPKILTGKNFYNGVWPENIKDVPSWTLESSTILGDDIKIVLLPPSGVI